MTIRSRTVIIALFAGAVLAVGGAALAHEADNPHAGHGADGAAGAGENEPQVEIKPADVKLLDLELLDQDGKKVRFRSDVIRDRIAIINVIYTSCPLVCPILSAIHAELQDTLKERLGKDVVLVSVSVDPVTDIPPRLKEYASRYNARPGWVFLTGEKQSVDAVLKGLGAYNPDFTQHPTMVLVGDGKNGGWTRFFGFPTPDQVMARVGELTGAAEAASAGGLDREGHHHEDPGASAESAKPGEPPAPRIPLRKNEEEQRRYFTDLVLLDQDGKSVRFYSDVLRGKVVLISFIYTTCTDICPILMQTLTEAQSILGDRMGRDVRFVSISVDPVDDTPDRLKEYGERFRAGPGWTFLTGPKDKVDWVTYRLGQYTPDFEDHSVLFLLGDVANGRWRKIRGDTQPELIALQIESLVAARNTGRR